MLLSRVEADEVIRRATSGRTLPVILLCEADSGVPVELFCKLSAGCDANVASLAREVVAACLARDLCLPVPQPYLVDVPTDIGALVTDPEIATLFQTSSSVAFGSAKVGNQFSIWTSTTRITDAMVPAAFSAIVFDGVIDNVDRRESNPNCLVSGDEFRLIDHELAFPDTAGLIGSNPPWMPGSLEWLKRDSRHIFCAGLKGRQYDTSPLVELWSNVSDDRLLEYRQSIPEEWSHALPRVDEALERISNGRDNIGGVIAEIKRVLT